MMRVCLSSMFCDGKSTRHLESGGTMPQRDGLLRDDKAGFVLRDPKSHHHVTTPLSVCEAAGTSHSERSLHAGLNQSRLLVSRESGSTPRILKSSTPPQPTSDSRFTTSRAESPHPSCPVLPAIDGRFSQLGHRTRCTRNSPAAASRKNRSRKHPTPIPSRCPLAQARPRAYPSIRIAIA